MEKGKIAFFNAEKGFGFIHPETGGHDLFVSHANIVSEGSPEEGMRVTYEPTKGKKGPEAVNVKLLTPR
ncbi:MAG: cold shock domain-containing protein [Simkaniaceae bacterium]|nr:cold shock domain-containing protein [Simkaniaceae bacterium]